MSEIRISDPLTSLEHRLAACRLILEKKLHYPIPDDRDDYSAMLDISLRVTENQDLEDLFDAVILVSDGEEIVGIGLLGTWNEAYHFQSYIIPSYRKQGLTTKMMRKFKDAHLIPERCAYKWVQLKIGACFFDNHYHLRTLVGVKLAAMYRNRENHIIESISYKWFIDDVQIHQGEYLMVTNEHLGKTLVMTAEVMTPTGLIKDYAKLTVK
jgi:GNAT superfamily N-acetyltransferase